MGGEVNVVNGIQSGAYVRRVERAKEEQVAIVGGGEWKGWLKGRREMRLECNLQV
jgi:hypothetical protein